MTSEARIAYRFAQHSDITSFVIVAEAYPIHRVRCYTPSLREDFPRITEVKTVFLICSARVPSNTQQASK